jgi:SET domain-containing protein
MKASSIKNSGFGVFAARSFEKDEFVTCYLGVLDLEPQDVTYTFKKINAAPELPSGELKEDYWFGHRINHGSGDKVNVTVNESYIIKSCKEISIDEELFLDYNTTLFCEVCHEEKDFYLKKSRKQQCVCFSGLRLPLATALFLVSSSLNCRFFSRV